MKGMNVMKEIYKKVPMMFIITAIILGGAATYNFSIFEYYGHPTMSYGDPLGFYILQYIFETLKTTIHYSFYFSVVYYLLKAIIKSTYGFIRNLLSTINPTTK